MIEDAKVDFWAIVEVMGRRKYAGRVTEQVIGGTSFVRVDVPAREEEPAFSKLFGPGSIYCITPVGEDVARGLASRLREQPVSVWDLPEAWRERIQARTLPTLVGDEDEDDYSPV